MLSADRFIALLKLPFLISWIIFFYFVVSRCQSLYLGGWNMAVVSVSLFFLYFLSLWSLQLEVITAEKLVFLLCKALLKVSYLIITLWISLEKVKYFDSNHSLGCNNHSFSLLIWYPCLSIFFRLFLTFFQFFLFVATFPWCLKFHASICWSRVTFRFCFFCFWYFSQNL